MEGITPENSRIVVSRAQEEKWASGNCRLTKILGWSMIAAFCFSIVAAFFQDRLMVDILMIIGGVAILRGSQAWIRFYCFSSICAVALFFVNISWGYLHYEPFEINNKWVDHMNLEFWYGYVCPAGMSAGLATLCVFTLRARKLVFWTSAAKRWGGGFIAAMLAFAAFSLVYQLFTSHDDEDIETELTALRHYTATSGTRYTIIKMHPVIDVLRQNPSILNVELCSAPNSSMSFYSAPNTSEVNDWDYEEFVKGPSGEWIKIKIRLSK